MKINVKSKESIIKNGIVWSHSKKEMKDQNVYCPILTVATNKSLSFYEVSVKTSYLVSCSFSLQVDQKHQV